VSTGGEDFIVARNNILLSGRRAASVAGLVSISLGQHTRGSSVTEGN
jgi:hypothetical protein